MKQRDFYRYVDAVAGRPWLHILDCAVADSLREIDRQLFVVFNRKRQQFEVHDAAVKSAAFTLVLAAPELDGRIVERVKLAAHSREPFKEADAWSKSERARIDRDLQRHTEAMAEELHDAAVLDDWGQSVFGRPYRPETDKPN